MEGAQGSREDYLEMDRLSILLLGTLTLPLLYSLLQVLQAFESLHFFLLLGIFSLLMIPVTRYLTEVILASIYVPAIISFLLLSLAGRPEFLLNLAAGYLIAFPLFLLLDFYTDSSPQLLTLIYLGGMLLSLYLLGFSGEQGVHVEALFRGLFPREGSRLLSPEAFSYMDPLFAVLTAFSTIALLWSLLRKLRPMESPLLGEEVFLTALLLSALVTFGIAVLSRVSGEFAWLLTFLVGGALALFLAVYPRLVGG